MFSTICPFCGHANDLAPPVEVPHRCVTCYRAFDPACSVCQKIFHACKCSGGASTRRITPVNVRIRNPSTSTNPPFTQPDDGWRTPPEKPKRADTEPIARTRTITSDKPYLRLDADDKEALDKLKSINSDNLTEQARDRLLIYLVEAVLRIENLVGGAPPEVLEEIRERRTNKS